MRLRRPVGVTLGLALVLLPLSTWVVFTSTASAQELCTPEEVAALTCSETGTTTEVGPTTSWPGWETGAPISGEPTTSIPSLTIPPEAEPPILSGDEMPEDESSEPSSVEAFVESAPVAVMMGLFFLGFSAGLLIWTTRD